jgi:hypothetical protein
MTHGKKGKKRFQNISGEYTSGVVFQAFSGTPPVFPGTDRILSVELSLFLQPEDG